MTFLGYLSIFTIGLANLISGYSLTNVNSGHGSCPDLLFATTEELSQGLRQRHFTSVDLVKAYTSRILEVNSVLHAITELNPDALTVAAKLDAERRRGKLRGPLHGVPILIKNNIATLDRMNNTAGSYGLLGSRVPRDAGVSKKLRKAGAILLGKTNLSQWANYRSDNSSNGWSAYGGQTYGAYYPQQDPSGSSSGSGVASSIGLALASLGTETDGSIISPSSQNGLAGIKPSVGLTSRSLVIPISSHQDTVGPMARTVKDAAYLLQAITGRDQLDNYTLAIPHPIPDYVAACRYSALRGKRIGIPRNLITGSDNSPVLRSFAAAIRTIKAAGATIVDNTNVTQLAIDFFETNAYDQILNGDFLTDLPGLYFSKLSANPQNLTSVETLRSFTQNFQPEDYPDRDTAIWDRAIELGLNNTSPRWWELNQQSLEAAGPQGILGALQNSSLDALILPTDYVSTFPARLGTPVVTVPMGAYNSKQIVDRTDRGLVSIGPNIPYGLSFLGPKWSEAKLISFAYAFEQRTNFRGKTMPYLTPKTQIKDVGGHCKV